MKTDNMGGAPANARVEFLEPRRHLDSARFDSSFGVDGIASYDYLASLSESMAGMAVTTAGQTVIVGQDNGENVKLYRYTATLAADAGFGTSGRVVLPDQPSVMRSVMDSSDRTIVATGNKLRRYLANGLLDASFGYQGTLQLSSSPNAIAVDGSKIVLLQSGSVARYTADGSNDGSMATTVAIPAGHAPFESIAVDSSGNVYVPSFDSGTQQVKIVKIKPQGGIDANYGVAGTCSIPVQGFSKVSVQIAPQIIAGKVTLVVWDSAASGFGFAESPSLLVVRANANGTLDTTFSGDGIADARRAGSLEVANAVAVDSTGRVLIAGGAGNTAVGYPGAVTRLTMSGNPDTSFDGDGVKVWSTSFYDVPQHLAIAPDGTIRVASLIAGRDIQTDIRVYRLDSTGATLATQTIAETGSLSTRSAQIIAGLSGDAYQVNYHQATPPTISHYLPDGQLDRAFGVNGHVSLQRPHMVGYTNGSVVKLAVQDDGKLLAMIPGADSYLDTAIDTWVYRFNTNGSLDQGFGNAGIAELDLAMSETPTTLLPLGGTEGVAIVSRSSSATNFIFHFARLNANGTQDMSFGTNGKVDVSMSRFSEVSKLYRQDNNLVAFGTSDDRPFVLRMSLTGQPVQPTTFIDPSGLWFVESTVASRAGGYMLTVYREAQLKNTYEYAIALLDSNGSLIGAPVLATEGRVGNSGALHARADGRLMYVTEYGPSAQTPATIKISMFKADGTPDLAFDTDGMVDLARSVTLPAKLSFASIFAFAPNDDIFVAGSYYPTGSSFKGDALVARIDVDSPVPPPPTSVTLQSELGTLSGGTGKATSHAGYTGTGYADYAGQNSAVTYSITRGSAGLGKLEFRYANGSTANRPLQVLVNNALVGTVACAPTGGWTNWANVSLNNVALPAGNVVIKVLASTSTGGANVDSLTITASDTVTPPPPPPPPPPTTGTDLALNKTTTASTIQASGNAAAKATDGSATTRWSSTYADNQWLQVDLGSANVITSVRLAWEAAFGKSYKIQGSNNASSWTDLYSTTTGDGGVDTINITNTTAWRYVRMLGLTRATKYGFSLFDFNVYGAGGTPPVEPPPVDPPPATTGSVGGFLFWDSNKNGKYDTGDTYQGGKVVFIDLDGDNVLDGNEKKLTTDANGKFNFTGLAAGTYKVRRVVPSGYKVTTAPANITITTAQVFSTVAIGSTTV